MDALKRPVPWGARPPVLFEGDEVGRATPVGAA
ncbi:hypothetical protein Shell_1509 [Staphylothermus hellenicus DSM 12710]|uniref:Uncharacterized protein n=1 Tax=Staphylothermus hellenicus (strain DSM 12710 / JCM 10830 / BK20S6-10-b1 / P8) TaxID=591019 RepID=D7DA01_STAHD|nr:hypothetical protein Shell_1509 [Staphylothermus hellenicus DSM 12710]